MLLSSRNILKMHNMTQSSPQQPIGTCCLLLNDNNQLLLGKRKNSYKAGMYGLPGGRVDINEPVEHAIEREVAEETGLENLIFTFHGVVRENQGSYDFIHFVFSAQVANVEPKLLEPDKCEGWEWFSLNDDLNDVLPGHKAGIELFTSPSYLADLTQ